ncbi:50S ribosomal protein L17 [bacterium]|nr:MAG: 50S ribosomal protein L17 [bacterium]
MRHKKHRHQLGVKKEHREALISTLASSLIIHGKMQTTLAKAKAVKPYVEKVITLAKKAAKKDKPADSVHLRRLAIARLRNNEAVRVLFNEKVSEFAGRDGGYTRIYKLGARQGDAAEMALIEFVKADDKGYSKGDKKAENKAVETAPAAEAPAPEVPASPAAEAAVES